MFHVLPYTTASTNIVVSDSGDLIFTGTSPDSAREGLVVTTKTVKSQLGGILVDVIYNKNKEIEVIYKKLNTLSLHFEPNIIVWKEVFGVVDGEIKMIKSINGTHIPAQPESFSFEE